jgi:hypothetical protein
MGSGGDPFFGGFCAYFAFFYPLELLFRGVSPPWGPLGFISLVVSGWINPLFIIVAILDWAEFQQRLASILRKAILAMIPFSWFFAFYEVRMIPREGHFLWIVGMLLTLYPKQFTPNAGSTAD